MLERGLQYKDSRDSIDGDRNVWNIGWHCIIASLVLLCHCSFITLVSPWHRSRPCSTMFDLRSPGKNLYCVAKTSEHRTRNIYRRGKGKPNSNYGNHTASRIAQHSTEKRVRKGVIRGSPSTSHHGTRRTRIRPFFLRIQIFVLQWFPTISELVFSTSAPPPSLSSSSAFSPLVSQLLSPYPKNELQPMV